MLNDDSSPASPPAEASPRPKKYRLVRRLLGLLTFVDLPIKRKFLLLTAGTLFWFASMAVVTVLALTAIQYKYHQVSEQIMPHQQAAHEVLGQLQNLDRDLQFMGQTDIGLDLLAVQSLREHVKAIRTANARLSLYQSAPNGTFIETLGINLDISMGYRTFSEDFPRACIINSLFIHTHPVTKFI